MPTASSFNQRRRLLGAFGAAMLLSALPVRGRAEVLAFPGGIALIELADRPVAAWFGRRRVWLAPLEERILALVGLDIDLLPGNYVLGLEFEDGSQAGLSFRVSPRPSKATAVLPADLPPPVALSPAEVLPEQWRRFHADSPPPPRHPPSAPTEARYVRNFEDQHPFISYLTEAGSAVYTPLAGQVVARLTGPSGAALVMHHGQSLLSVMHPLQNIPVQTGEPVSIGQRIGHTAPSSQSPLGWLNWAMLMNGASIDPDALRALLPIDAE